MQSTIANDQMQCEVIYWNTWKRSQYKYVHSICTMDSTHSAQHVLSNSFRRFICSVLSWCGSVVAPFSFNFSRFRTNKKLHCHRMWLCVCYVFEQTTATICCNSFSFHKQRVERQANAVRKFNVRAHRTCKPPWSVRLCLTIWCLYLPHWNSNQALAVCASERETQMPWWTIKKRNQTHYTNRICTSTCISHNK